LLELIVRIIRDLPWLGDILRVEHGEHSVLPSLIMGQSFLVGRHGLDGLAFMEGEHQARLHSGSLLGE